MSLPSLFSAPSRSVVTQLAQIFGSAPELFTTAS